MASLTGLQINNTYPGLIKTTDNAAIDGAPRILTDGEGNALPIQVSTAGTDFNGNVDFAAATVTGLPAAGVTSIIAGTGISIDQATGAVTVTNNIVDYNTTYDLAAAANGANIDLNLTGSDATVDTVSIVAGTNITLAEAAGVVTIDAGTYDLASAQDGANVDITLTGSDATVDTVQLTAGTNITLTEAAGSITIDAAGGGGGGGMEATLWTTARGVNMTNGSNTTSADLFKVTYMSDTYGMGSTTISNNKIKVVAMSLLEGQDVNSFAINVTTATSSGTVTAALYKAELGTAGNIQGGDLEYNFGTIDATTIGLKVVGGVDHTLGSTVDNTYFLAVWNGSGSTLGIQAVNSTNVAATAPYSSMYASTAYRGTTFERTASTFPTALGTASWSKATDFPVYGLKFN
tara:strand:- start:91 stop:1305 length:1215 start_codon:yes stop_codon:yes gene_type:complete